jgi:endonuclease/exonuclease/phosphatase family metal-dependent hydrolase
MSSVTRLFLSVFLIVSTSLTYAGIKMTTYNIRTFDLKNSSTNKVELKKIITKLNSDFITVQEIVNHKSFTKFIIRNFKGYKLHLSKCGGGGRQKIGFLYRSDKFTLEQVYEDKRLSDTGQIVGEYGCGRLRPALVGVFKEKKTKKKFVVIGIHLKAGGTANSYEKRKTQYKIVSRIIEELRLADLKNIILMGDFNSTGFIHFDADYVNFTNMLTKSGMRTSSKDLKCTAYWAGKNRTDNKEESSVLDHIIYPASFLSYKRSRVSLSSHCKRVSCHAVSADSLGLSYKEVSDHCPVSTTFY